MAQQLLEEQRIARRPLDAALARSRRWRRDTRRRARSPPGAAGGRDRWSSAGCPATCARQAWSKRIAFDARGHDQERRAVGDRPGRASPGCRGSGGPPSARPRPRGAAAAACCCIRTRSAAVACVCRGCAWRCPWRRRERAGRSAAAGPEDRSGRRADHPSPDRRPQPVPPPPAPRLGVSCSPSSPSRLRTRARIASCAGAGAEIEHQGDMAGEARGCRQRLELLDHAGLADARLATDHHGLAGAGRRGRRRARPGTARARRACRRTAGPRARPRRPRSDARPGPARPGP